MSDATQKKTEKQRLIAQIVDWRQKMKGSISAHNHRRLLNTWSTRELKYLWERIQVGEGTTALRELGR